MTHRASKPPIWQLPALIGGIVLGLGATGTGIVKLARFLTIVDRVEAAEARNAEQDKSLEQLSYIAGQNQAILDRITQPTPNQAMHQAAPPPGLREYDERGQCWTCPVEDRRACFDQDLWRWCLHE